jgi:glycosyltransferase involved in cell wall biosynthesis
VKTILYITNRYRLYDLLKYRVLSQRLDLRVIWINPFPDSERPPDELLQQIHFSVVDPTNATVLKPWHLLRTLRLALLTSREAASADLVLSTTSDSWKSKVVCVIARLRGARVALRKEKWIDDRVRLGPLARAYWTLDRWLTDWIERRADALLVGGSKAEEHLLKKGIPESSILPFSYLHEDLAEYPVDPKLLRRLRSEEGSAVTFLYLGRIMPQKGLDVLLVAFNRLCSEGCEARLLVVGDAIRTSTGRGGVSVDYLDSCRRIAASNPRVLFHGPVSPGKVNNCYLAADVFVHPHVREVEGREVHEGWGNVVSEAACMSKPIVTTDRVASAFDLVAPGVNGYLLDSGTLADGLLDALRFFCENPRQISTFGRESRKRYESVISPERTLRSLELLMTSNSP